MKKLWNFPVINPLNDEGDSTVVGGGTGQDTTDDPYPCSFNDWMTLFQDNYDGDEDGIIDFEDYRTWWEDNEFSMEAWDEYNPGVPFSVEP